MNAEQSNTFANLAEADRVAKGKDAGQTDSGPLAACPASQPQVFVVPVRYALAQTEAEHAALQPGVTTHSHPLAARRLRQGFLYVWLHRGPLQRYGVDRLGLLREEPLDQDDTVLMTGELTGLAMNKQQQAWMLYTEYPLNAEHCQRLSDPAIRQQHMRSLNLSAVADELQAAHCPPLSAAEEVVAELLPDVFARSVAIDRKRNGPAYQKGVDELGETMFKAPTAGNIKAYNDAMYWLKRREDIAAPYPHDPLDESAPGEWGAEPWDAIATQDWLHRAQRDAQGLWPVFACLDDDLGVLRDINHEQEWLEHTHQQWMNDNTLRLTVGGFVRSLIREDAGEIAGVLSYRYREQDILLSVEQGQIMLDAHHKLDELFKEESRINQEVGRLYDHYQATSRREYVQQQVQDAVAPVRAFIPQELHTQVEAVVREYRAEKVANLENHALSEKVGEFIDLNSMDTWLDETAPAHLQAVEQRHQALYNDRGHFLTRHHSGTWFVDYDDWANRNWLDQLANACLSAQCLRHQGAEQYADYVRSADPGALRQLFFGWSPTLESALNVDTRLGEVLAALSDENQENFRLAMTTLLAPVSNTTLKELGNLANNRAGTWNLLVNRLASSLLLLRPEHPDQLSSAWASVLMATRLGDKVGLAVETWTGFNRWTLSGGMGPSFMKWAENTGRAIGRGQTANILSDTVVRFSGGMVPLAALMLNSWNTSNYLSEAQGLESVDQKRFNDTVSAGLYTAAALAAVVDSQIRDGLQKREINLRYRSVPTLTLFGTLIGGLSFYAAYKELGSLQIQLENAQGSIDPWLEMRRNVVGGQITAYGVQALLGFTYTARVLFGYLSVDAGIAAYSLWMAPVTFAIAALGVMYLIAWAFELTPFQHFLRDCCWSKERGRDLSTIPEEKQHQELGRLYDILYRPRIGFKALSIRRPAINHRDGYTFSSVIESLTIDLPGAVPDNARLELQINGGFPQKPQSLRQDLGNIWLNRRRCQWIPQKEGQGLRLSASFNPPRNWSNPATRPVSVYQDHEMPNVVSVRLRYHLPLLSMLGPNGFIGGWQGVAYTVTPADGAIYLGSTATPELDTCRTYALGVGQFARPFHMESQE